MLSLRRIVTIALFLHGLSPAVYASTVAKRATCTPASAGNSGTDDVPAIEAAFKSCGNGGIIIIPAGKTYAIRSTVDFTGCVNCDFQIEGTLKMSEDLTFWNGKQATFLISGITGLKMRSGEYIIFSCSRLDLTSLNKSLGLALSTEMAFRTGPVSLTFIYIVSTQH